jgi:DNA-binding transcriptional regulator GbsR (MarR family)
MNNNENWKRNKQYKQCSLERNEQQRQKGTKKEHYEAEKEHYEVESAEWKKRVKRKT